MTAITNLSCPRMESSLNPCTLQRKRDYLEPSRPVSPANRAAAHSPTTDAGDQKCKIPIHIPPISLHCVACRRYLVTPRRATFDKLDDPMLEPIKLEVFTDFV